MASADRWSDETHRVARTAFVAFGIAIIPNAVRAFTDPDPSGRLWTGAVLLVQGVAAVFLLILAALALRDLLVRRRPEHFDDEEKGA